MTRDGAESEMTAGTDDRLAALLGLAQAGADALPAGLAARMLEDAGRERVVRAVPSHRPPSVRGSAPRPLAGLFAALGGFAGLAGLAAAGLAGLWIGYTGLGLTQDALALGGVAGAAATWEILPGDGDLLALGLFAEEAP